MPRERPLVVAHRGASAAWPEHTRAAYLAAVEAGADALECDVRLSADGHAVCIHDSRLDRTSNGTGRVARSTLAQLRALDWGSWHPSAAGGTRRGAPGDPRALVTLAELVDLVLAAPRPVGLLVEAKHPAGAALDAAVARAVAPAVGRLPLLALMSFWPPAVRRFAALAPGVTRAALHPGLWPLPLLGAPDAVGVHVALVRRRPGAVSRHRRAGRQVWVWTVNDEADVRRCVAAGADAIITDRPAEVRGMLAR